jgi:hypothetical protein
MNNESANGVERATLRGFLFLPAGWEQKSKNRCQTGAQIAKIVAETSQLRLIESSNIKGYGVPIPLQTLPTSPW